MRRQPFGLGVLPHRQRVRVIVRDRSLSELSIKKRAGPRTRLGRPEAPIVVLNFVWKLSATRWSGSTQRGRNVLRGQVGSPPTTSHVRTTLTVGSLGRTSQENSASNFRLGVARPRAVSDSVQNQTLRGPADEANNNARFRLAVSANVDG
jgi:hypothetical protein